MSVSSAQQLIITRERLLIMAGLVVLTGLAWLYLISMANDMEQMGEAMMAASAAPWTATEFVLMFIMWSIMMVGMMLPSATPMIWLFVAVNRRQQTRGQAVAPTAVFIGGYLATWTAFSLGATLLQWLLHSAGLLSPMMATTSTLLGGAVLIAAGVYQWTPLKGSCLRHCQSPLQFITRHWRNGTGGAFRMGAEHGVYCLGCCWFLMCLLFIGGVMNLLWIAALAVFVLLEKVAPSRWIPASSGLVLVVWGMLVLAQGAGSAGGS